MMNYNVSLISELKGLTLDGEFDQKFIDGLITSNPKHLDSTLSDKNFINYHGDGTVERILKSTNYVINSNIDSLRILHGTDDELQISQNTYRLIGLFSECFWFLKDCCVHRSNLFTNIPAHKRTFGENSVGGFSKANGEIDDSKFNKQEILKVIEWTLTIRPLFISKGVKSPKPILNQYRFGSHRYDNPKTDGRVKRAWRFLFYARSTTSVSLKISFYVMALESLFSIDDTEIAHKVSERIAIYLGGTPQQEMKTFAFIKTIYTFRSKFVHGSPVDSKGLAEISIDADELLRKVMTKIFLSDYNTFNEGNKLGEYFKDLIFRNMDTPRIRIHAYGYKNGMPPLSNGTSETYYPSKTIDEYIKEFEELTCKQDADVTHAKVDEVLLTVHNEDGTYKRDEFSNIMYSKVYNNS